MGIQTDSLGKLLPISLPKAPKLKDQLGYELRHHPEHGLASSHCPWSPVWGILGSTPPPASWHRDPNIHSKQPVARGHGVISDSTCALVSLPQTPASRRASSSSCWERPIPFPGNLCVRSLFLLPVGRPHPTPALKPSPVMPTPVSSSPAGTEVTHTGLSNTLKAAPTCCPVSLTQGGSPWEVWEALGSCQAPVNGVLDSCSLPVTSPLSLLPINKSNQQLTVTTSLLGFKRLPYSAQGLFHPGLLACLFLYHHHAQLPKPPTNLVKLPLPWSTS